MQVTIAICTWNRASLLEDALSQFCNIVIPMGIEWELLVICNNCTDDTPTVLIRYASRLPLRVVNEPRQGLVHARNRALVDAKGDLLLWTDDDTLVDSKWLAAYVAAAHKWPEAGFFGGQVIPHFESQIPHWYAANKEILADAQACKDYGPDERWLTDVEHPIGPNMALRRGAFQHVRFDPSLGLNGKERAIRGEEVRYIDELRKLGVRGVWVPSARVRHVIQTDQMTLEYVWRYFEALGRWRVRNSVPDRSTRLFGAPRWLYREYWQLRAKYPLQRVAQHPRWLETYVNAAETRGRIVEYHNLHNGSHAST
jgi:glycosyltransferase involved in cell wall biosynthesis